MGVPSSIVHPIIICMDTVNDSLFHSMVQICKTKAAVCVDVVNRYFLFLHYVYRTKPLANSVVSIFISEGGDGAMEIKRVDGRCVEPNDLWHCVVPDG